MSDLSTQVLPYNLPTPTTLARQCRVRRIRGADRQASQWSRVSRLLLSNMLGQMFEGVSTDGPFGGGQGEGVFRSLLMDAFAQQITKSGGVGVGAAVQREMLKMQGLSLRWRPNLPGRRGPHRRVDRAHRAADGADRRTGAGLRSPATAGRRAQYGRDHPAG